jgi:hypothetical protein
LYRAIDTANDGYVSRDDFKNFMLPSEPSRSRLVSEDIVMRQRGKTVEDLNLLATVKENQDHEDNSRDDDKRKTSLSINPNEEEFNEER